MVLRKYSTHMLFPSPESIFGGLFVLLKVAEVSLFVIEYLNTFPLKMHSDQLTDQF